MLRGHLVNFLKHSGNFWGFCRVLNTIWKSYEPTLAIFYAMGQACFVLLSIYTNVNTCQDQYIPTSIFSITNTIVPTTIHTNKSVYQITIKCDFLVSTARISSLYYCFITSISEQSLSSWPRDKMMWTLASKSIQPTSSSFLLETLISSITADLIGGGGWGHVWVIAWDETKRCNYQVHYPSAAEWY